MRTESAAQTKAAPFPGPLKVELFLESSVGVLLGSLLAQATGCDQQAAAEE
jgi:hypothetical protein